MRDGQSGLRAGKIIVGEDEIGDGLAAGDQGFGRVAVGRDGDGKTFLGQKIFQ